MEFDSSFTLVQGALLSVEKSFETSLLEIDKEYESEVKDAIKAVQTVIEEQDIQENDLRRLHLLFVLNTEFPSINLLEDDINYCHLIGSIPKISPYLYFKLTEHLKLHQYMGEAISHCPEVLSLDIVTCVSSYMKKLDNSNAVNFLYSLYESLFEKVVDLRNCESLNKKHKFVKVFQSLLAFSVKDIYEHLPWKVEQKYHFMGHAIRMYLTLLETCTLRFKRGCVTRQSDLYKMTMSFDYSQWDCVKSEIDWAVHCLELLIAKCKKLAMDITVDMYMSWCEVDLESPDKKTLQTAVREVAYTCKEALSSLSTEEFPGLPLLVLTLNNFALKPKSEEDELREATVDTILFNLQNPDKTKEKWFCALLKANNLFMIKNFEVTIRENMSLFNLDLMLLLIRRVHEYLRISENFVEDNERARDLVLDCVKSLPVPIQLSLLMEFYKSYGNTSFLKSADFDDNLTEVLNKVVYQDEQKEKSHPTLISLCFQSGQCVIQRLLKDSVTSENLGNTALSLIKGIFPLSHLNVFQDNSIKVTTHVIIEMMKSSSSLSPEEKQNFVFLVKNLAKSNFLDIDYFLSEQLMILIENSASEEEWSNILFWLDLLLPFADGSCGAGAVEKPVVELSFIIQTLSKCRRQPKFFSPIAMEACEKCIVLVKILVDIVIQTKKDEDSEIIFLRGMASSLTPLTWYHLGKLWTNWGQDLPKDDGTLNWSRPYLGHTGLTTLSDPNRASVVTSLCKILPLLTSLEWKMIGTDACDASINEAVALFNILLDGLLVLLQIRIMLRNLACLSQTVANFITFIKVRTHPCLVAATSHEHSTAVLGRIVLMLNEIPAEIVKVRLMQILKVMQDILLTSLEKSKSEDNLVNLKEIIESISDETVRSGLSKVLQETTTASDQPAP